MSKKITRLHIPEGFISFSISHDLLEHEISFDRLHQPYALAKHHGMATRLLDWTQHPLYAAFFAAENPEE